MGCIGEAVAAVAARQIASCSAARVGARSGAGFAAVAVPAPAAGCWRAMTTPVVPAVRVAATASVATAAVWTLA